MVPPLFGFTYTHTEKLLYCNANVLIYWCWLLYTLPGCKLVSERCIWLRSIKLYLHGYKDYIHQSAAEAALPENPLKKDQIKSRDGSVDYELDLLWAIKRQCAVKLILSKAISTCPGRVWRNRLFL